MNDEYIKPFADALLSTIEIMSGFRPVVQPYYIKKSNPTPGDISGMIGITGRAFVGSIALIFPEKLILKVVKRMTGDSKKAVKRYLNDAIIELANIAAGGGKSILSERGINFNITLPTNDIGNHNEINYGSHANVVVIPYDLEGDRFHMELMLKSIAS